MLGKFTKIENAKGFSLKTIKMSVVIYRNGYYEVVTMAEFEKSGLEAVR